MQKRRQHRKPMSDINIVPYIDVMLVLLVIFMITAPLLQQGVNVQLPQAKAKIIDSKDKTPVIVSVDANGLYYLNISSKPDNAISQPALTAQIKAALARNPQRSVLVNGDKAANYGNVVTAMALLQQAGVKDVGLLTQDHQ